MTLNLPLSPIERCFQGAKTGKDNGYTMLFDIESFIEEADIQSERFWDLVTLGFEQNEKNSAEELRLAKGQDRT